MAEKILTAEQKAHILRRGVSSIISEREFTELLEDGTSLRLKMGFDPSSTDIHLGHAVGLRKLRQLQDIGHKVVIIVGDWTAQIGDPSGRDATRPMLTHEQVQENAETYLTQFFEIVDRDRCEVRWQSEWFGSFDLADILRLASRFTVAQILERDDFEKRLRQNKAITIPELLYPMLQAYDSVAIEADVEFGGGDQMFNLLLGRDLQRAEGQRPQQCFHVPLLVGTDGIEKMSKSLGNYIGIAEHPNDMFGKIMSLSDDMMPDYFEYLTDVPYTELSEIKESMSIKAVNPMDVKKRLASDIIGQFHGAQAAAEARDFFERTVQGGETPDDILTLALGREQAESTRLSALLAQAGMASSSSEARRLISRSAVRLDGTPIEGNIAVSELGSGGVLRIGRRRFMRLELETD